MSSVSRYLAHELSKNLSESVESLSFFASPKFLAIWQPLGGTGVYWCCEHNGIITILPGVEYGTGMLARFQSLPDGIYSSPLSFKNTSSIQSTRDDLVLVIAAIAKRRYCKAWLYDYSHCFPANEQFTLADCETHVVDISAPNWEPPDAAIRSEIRKAERENISIERFDKRKHFESFLTLMLQTEARHNRKPKYPASFFDALADLAVHDSRIVWKQCTHDGQAAASHIFFIEGTLALHWQVYFDKTFSWLKPNQSILFQTIRELQQRGVTTLSLGASPEDAEGLRTYKEKWGGVPYHYHSLSSFTWLGKLL